MKKINILILIALFSSGFCHADLNTGLVISIGDKSSYVKKLMGHRNRGDSSFDSYFKHGLVVQYSPESIVVSISAGIFETGQRYSGEVLGVKIGDNISKSIELWGNPVSSENVKLFGVDLGDKLYFQYKNYLIKLEVWNEDGVDSGMGAYSKDTIRDIEIRIFTEEIYGTWYSKKNNEYIVFSPDGSAKSCQKGKKRSIYLIHGNIQAKGQVLWEGWKNNKNLLESPDEWWSGSEIYLVSGILVVEGLQRRKSYKRINYAVPEECKF